MSRSTGAGGVTVVGQATQSWSGAGRGGQPVTRPHRQPEPARERWRDTAPTGRRQPAHRGRVGVIGNHGGEAPERSGASLCVWADLGKRYPRRSAYVPGTLPRGCVRWHLAASGATTARDVLAGQRIDDLVGVVRPAGFEPATVGLGVRSKGCHPVAMGVGGCCSIRLCADTGSFERRFMPPAADAFRGIRANNEWTCGPCCCGRAPLRAVQPALRLSLIIH